MPLLHPAMTNNITSYMAYLTITAIAFSEFRIVQLTEWQLLKHLIVSPTFFKTKTVYPFQEYMCELVSIRHIMSSSHMPLQVPVSGLKSYEYSAFWVTTGCWWILKISRLLKSLNIFLMLLLHRNNDYRLHISHKQLSRICHGVSPG